MSRKFDYGRTLEDTVRANAPVKRKPGRPRKDDGQKPEIVEGSKRRIARGEEIAMPPAEDMLAGVSVSYLAMVFRLDPYTVRKRLADCPRKGKRANGYYYDLAEAARYLVKPALPMSELVKNLKRGDLPEHLRDTAWNALLKQQQWGIKARELWHTSDVMEVVGDAFQTIKFTIQLWADEVEEKTELSKKQREIIIEMADTLQRKIYDKLVENAKEKATRPQLFDVLKMEGMSPAFQDSGAEPPGEVEAPFAEPGDDDEPYI